MKLNERFDVRPEKLAELKARIARLGIDMNLVEETFTRGGGKGGQKVNKTSNAVCLKYPPLDLVVRCHRERRRTVNRFLALRQLVDRIEGVLRARKVSAARSEAGTPSAEGPSPAEA
ncbi:MAG: peptide chain release factor [Elusimicrobia bacterium]|nr:MAG: peptide chain release factor [Elusimicrobiota bacterium]